MSGTPWSDPPSPLTPQASNSLSEHPDQIFDAVLLTRMPTPEKENYRQRTESELADKVEMDIDEIIGEYREGGRLWYYARFENIPASTVEMKYAPIVAEYYRKKTAGALEPFDPSAGYVHPKSRVRQFMTISKRGATLTVSSDGSVPATSDRDYDEVPETDEEGEGAGGDNDDYDGEESSVPPPRATRSSKGQLELPFSPKKTRSQKIQVIDSDDSDDDDSVAHAPRRSTRTRRTFKIAVGDDSDAEEDDSDGDASVRKLKGTTKRPKVARKKAARPAYGHVRGIEDLDYDHQSDEETAPLRMHRNVCEKCKENPAHEVLGALKKKKNKSRRRKKTSDDDIEGSEDEVERAERHGGWVRWFVISVSLTGGSAHEHSLKCPVSVHWGCLASTQRSEILKAAREVDRSEWRKNHSEDDTSEPEPAKRRDLGIQETTDFLCASCTKGGICMGCLETAVEPAPESSGAKDNEDVEMKEVSDVTLDTNASLVFRCLTCKRMAHYAHLPVPDDLDSDASPADIAGYYVKNWLCGDCASYTYSLDKILAWRPYPPNAVEADDDIPTARGPMPREYLVKWVDRSYLRTSWVPHNWLVSTSNAKLKNFLATGSKVDLLDDDGETKHTTDPSQVSDSRAASVKSRAPTPGLAPGPLPDAEQRIPPAWKTVDRVLDVVMWTPPTSKKKGKTSTKQRIDSDEDEDEDKDLVLERNAAYDQGRQPEIYVQGLQDWEASNRTSLSIDDIDKIAWIFVKWDDLTYDEATWDSPPRPDDDKYPAFRNALGRFLASRKVFIKNAPRGVLPNRRKDGYAKYRLKEAADLQLGQDPKFKLMDFQVDGFNWLCDNWWNEQQCILADEMGLGKTVQIVTFLGKIIQDFSAAPALVVVPNSTITNWVREFERWAPKLRVVPFYGEAKSREIIRKYELSHNFQVPKGTSKSKFHVLVTTYETLIGKDFSVFRSQSCWEVLVIDEGQRLKSDSSLLFKKLNELNSLHRVIMTGTPLNNNIRQVCSIDPQEWDDLEGLARDHEDLTEDLVKELHGRLRPYFLRRIKSQNEVIVPLSMAPLQKQIYRSILSHNLDILKGLTGPTIRSASKGKLNNVLMHLRKCLQHPYLYEETIEPKGLSVQETHQKLIDASAKLVLLKSLLPKLKARGHRVLLFSQFVLALDVVEDFLNGEGYRSLRLDGNTKSKDRQKDMDEFNREGSDVFIYLLTTRAGGVGINLYTADTVIIFDPDFNPHQDLQAIARAYRYGQKKTCLVFKLMVKDSAEERIMQVGKKKLVLDHLIVQKMDDDDGAGDDVQSILTYGAQALFEDVDTRDITYSDADLDKLIEKTEKEAEPEQKTEEAFSFSFAKVWAAEKDTLEEVVEKAEPDVDSWAQTLLKITAEREKTQAQEMARSGRGVRRQAAKNFNYTEPSPAKEPRSRSHSQFEEGSAYGNSSVNGNSTDSGSEDVDG
ncbi:unnamed protein product [Mycena citricolor]|uniref:Uncharacterized protein n=1 Tax=Mycena citricolor TaxID=2018698 RepID=A0AAD2K5A4_9AGAR|nr:unnamed protein product [Mycena citricolor]